MVGHRNCAVVGCGNSGAKLQQWIKQRCPTHNCNQGRGHCDCPAPFRLLPFPTKFQNNELRQRWIRTMKRKTENGKNWEPNDDSRVCSIHFPDGCPTDENPEPTINLGYSAIVKNKVTRKPPSLRLPMESPVPKKKNKTDIDQELSASDSSHHICGDVEVINICQNQACQNEKENKTDIDQELSATDSSHHICVEPEVINICQNQACQNEKMKLRHSVEFLKTDIKRWKRKFSKKVNKPFSSRSLNSDKKIKHFTGIPNKAAFNVLFGLLKSKVPKLKYWSGPSKVTVKKRIFSRTPKKSGPKRVLPSRDEFLMTLMKLRLGSTNTDLAERFKVSETTVSKIINTWVRFLAKEWKCLIHNPPKDIALQHLPKKFGRKYNNVRYIIDCTEVFIETPKDPKIRAATWSDYKHHQTLKILVSIMPCGTFNFVSEGWGGRTSDVAITRESGFYDLLERGDEVMADKGFTIAEDLLVRHCRLHMPPGKRGHEQMTNKDVKKTKEIANLRIFVEQAIRRLKTFRMLKHEMPISLLDKFDDIVTICSALCNLYPKLCK